MLKTHTCGELNRKNVGQAVTLAGWVHRRRDHGGLIFIDVRDRWGLTQVVFNPTSAPEVHARASDLRNEFVLQVSGAVQARPAGQENLNLTTGEIEVAASDMKILNPSRVVPFAVNKEENVDENLRLTYRYLDLRRERMQKNILLRHRVVKFMRDWLDERGFIEIETPIMTKSTPEGARDYLVPSRINPGKFYALPQSPQQFKQLLMVAGYEKYFQIARCMRDEDLRADRQPEFTQLDLEMAFVEQEDVLNLVEQLFTELLGTLLPERKLKTPWPRLTYEEAMARYGSDKPDLRFGLELVDVSEIAAQSGFGVFKSSVASGGQVKGIRIAGQAQLTRREIDELTEFAKGKGAKGLVTMAFEASGVKSPIAKFLSAAEIEGLAAKMGAQTGDLLLFVADKPKVAAVTLGALDQPTAAGAEQVEFLVSLNPGMGERPLARAASGGELSRVMLALKAELAAHDAVPTLVFDEVDQGIGGRAAVAVGRRLARLAGRRQVVVVTHLPQIAVFADRHIRVRKQDGTASVEVLDDAGRVAELSRMLSGLPESEAAATHAEELLAEAGKARAASDAPRAGRRAASSR